MTFIEAKEHNLAVKSTKSKVNHGDKKGSLLIVESPSKAKTIGKYLGSKYNVIASVGHIIDLPKSKLGVDTENNFEPEYIQVRGKAKVIKEIKSAAAKAENIYVATDPDREGEAIAWHIGSLIGLPDGDDWRVTFNEVTKDKVLEALKSPHSLDMGLVNAQQARRVLDRLVGYKLSPLLWRKGGKGLTAGRVQSVALRIICDREDEIDAFVPQEYWEIYGNFQLDDGSVIKAILHNKTGSKKKLNITSGEMVEDIAGSLGTNGVISSTEKKLTKRSPAPPFTTSSMQQDAATRLGFSSKKTMQIAQQLYEGIEIKGKGTTGLITYLRTDSVRISPQAKAAAKEYITGIHGEKYYKNNVFSNKKKDIQDAHEAIRPSDVYMHPESIKSSLTADQFKLYNLIWRRFVASQMAPSEFQSTNVVISQGEYDFKANGSIQVFDGYKKEYNFSGDERDKLIPEVEKGDEVKLIEPIEKLQKFTNPPARFTEASIVKELEDKNIGRPSTYATIISTLLDRNYVVKQEKQLVPTTIGRLVTNAFKKYFDNIVDVGFTASMEENLDDVEKQEKNWHDVIHSFYEGFEEKLENAMANMEYLKVPPKESGEICEKCGRPMLIREGRFGPFLACSGFPDCKNSKPIQKKLGVKCPKCGGEIIERKSKKGRIFYGCSNYPECDFVSWDPPTGVSCPKCGSPMTKKPKAKYSMCTNKDCGYKE